MEDNKKESDSGGAIRFVYFDDKDGNFKMDPHAIHLLQQMKEPVAAVSVCGPSRQGKSFILNQILGRSTGFQVGSTHQTCTKGLWMWSTPLKKTALDGTEYNLLLFDCGGTDVYDQTGMYSIQIFSLAVLLSSLFVYNQVGVIDEAALDHLSLVTEMTKHIHRRASEGKDRVFELGNFSPIFILLLRDFYLDLKEGNTKIKPRDYLELFLRPLLGSERDVAAKNQIRESIRAVFPCRECFTLVRPLNDETDLRHLDQVLLDKCRPEFQSGVDAFVNFIYNRTMPKQIGDTVMTGPLLFDITKSFLDVLNNGAAPTISFSWQVCSRDSIIETDLQCSNAIQSMEKKLQEACLATDARIKNVATVLDNLISEYEESVQGPMKWQKLSSFLQKSLQGPIVHYAQKMIDGASLEKSSLMLKCRSIEDKIELLHKHLGASEKSKTEYKERYEDAINDFTRLCDKYKCRINDLESMLSLLEERCSRSLEMVETAKQETLEWEKNYEELLTAKTDNNQASANMAIKSGIDGAKARVAAAIEQSRLALKEANEWKEKYDIVVNEAKAARVKVHELVKLMEGNADAAAEQCQLALKEANEWKEKYNMVINEAKAAREKAAEQAKLKEEDFLAAAEQSRLFSKEANEWKEKYDIAINEAKAARDEVAEQSKFKEDAAAGEQSRLALKEANEWKEKYDIAINEANAAGKKAAKQAKLIEEDLKAKLMNTLAEKDEEIKDKVAKLKESEQRLSTLTLDLKAAETKIENYLLESSALKLQVKELAEKYDLVKEAAQTMEREAQTLVEDRIQLEQKYLSELKRFEEANEGCKVAKEEVKVTNEFIEAAQSEVRTSQNEKSDSHQLPIDRPGQASAHSHAQILEGESEVERSAASDGYPMSKVAILEAMIRERDEEIALLKKKCEQFVDTVPTLENDFKSEHAACTEANKMEQAPSLLLESTPERLKSLKQDLTPDHANVHAQGSGLKTCSGRKHAREEFPNASLYSAKMENQEEIAREMKKPKISPALAKCTTADIDSLPVASEGEDEHQKAASVDYTKLTVWKLRQELNDLGFGEELQKLKYPKKKDIIALYEKFVLKK